jgi:hypothetical protein
MQGISQEFSELIFTELLEIAHAFETKKACDLH